MSLVDDTNKHQRTITGHFDIEVGGETVKGPSFSITVTDPYSTARAKGAAEEMANSFAFRKSSRNEKWWSRISQEA